ncbi:MAG: LPS assembly protein LptD [Methylophaga sp.]|nr:LPS assembly protein LptD [Methylophaga sp.]
MRRLTILSTALLMCFSSLSMAESGHQQCKTDNHNKYLPIADHKQETAVDVKADSVQLVEEGTSVFTGNVEVTRSGQELKSDRATYNQLSGNVTANGNVQMRDSDIILNSEQAEWSLSNDEGTLLDADYRLRESHARGKANQVYRQGTEKTLLKDATYTTCDEGSDAWLLESSNVKLDHVTAVGEARDVVIRLGGLPVFYTPYISFPLNDERKSGFLTPMVGSSDETGFDLRTPYYWNVAPNADATITPRYMADRGFMLNGEFRYLTEQHQGVLDAGFLASDDLEKDDDILNPYYKEDRKHFSLQNTSRLGSRWHSNIDYNYVSDKAYIEDFASSLSLTSTTHLKRQLNVGYAGNNWNFVGRLQGYQNLTSVSNPYQRLPQLLVTGLFPEQAMGLTYGITAEYVAFDHDDKVKGQRFNLEPSISLPWSSAAAFVTPRIALNHTRYDLDENGGTISNDDPTRTLPIVSVDSGLFFERELRFSNSNYIHTLEPRAFYLYIPERDQSDIPIFDSSLRTFSMGQLFSHDRFTGADRIGDTSQLSLSLTSRIINQETGKENLRVSLGQIQYFKDRNVTLLNTAPETQSDSDMVAEVVASIAKEWTVRGEMQWDPHGDTNNMSALGLNYRGEQGQLLNLSHRYRRDGLEQVDISTRIPFNKQWSIVGRWYHSIKDSRTLEGLAGIEYDSCCWATRLVVRNYVNSSTDQDRNLAIFFQIELKGLGNFGKKTETLLEKNILGYGS